MDSVFAKAIKVLRVRNPAGTYMPVMLVTNVHPDVIKANYL